MTPNQAVELLMTLKVVGFVISFLLLLLVIK